MTDYTASIQKKAMILHIISLSLTVLPILVFVFKAFLDGNVSASRKLCMGLLVFFSFFLTIINVLFKYSIRSTIWLLLLGIYVCLDNIIPLLIIIAITTIIDEFVITPLYKKYRSDYKVNKEIDKREQFKESNTSEN